MFYALSLNLLGDCYIDRPTTPHQNLQGGDRRSKLKGKDQELLQTIVAQQNDIYLQEIQATLAQNQGIEVSVSSLSRTLKRLKLGRKKKL